MSIASQLRAIKSVLKGKDDPIRRPITRPSILFDPKEAADIDLRSILPLALSGLESLIEVDDRFSSFNCTLFSHATLEIDREKMTPKEEEKLNKSLCSYLRLLAGQLHHPSAFMTLEYLIRRYQVHIFNVEELVLCALPYHGTHAFVRIVQLLDFRSKKWAFLEGVKASGAPLPRKVIVQQCIRDKEVLESLCNYATPTKDFQHSRAVICFCTAVTVEVLGSLPILDTDTIQKILAFVFNGLNPAIGGSPDHAAGALMVVGLIATRATLAAKLVQNLVFFIARFAQHDAKKSLDLSRLRVTIMAMVTLVQSQSSQTFPKKTITMLKDIRDFIGILFGLSQEFNIRKFLRLYVESLIAYSLSDDCYYNLLANVLETFPVNDFVEKIVHNILGQCMKSLHADGTNSNAAGIRAKQILAVINEKHPSELRGTVHKFLKSSKVKLEEKDFTFTVLCHMLDGNSNIPIKLSDSKVWFSLEHPEATVRQATLLDLASSGDLDTIVEHPWKLVNLKEAIIRRLLDDDLTVVHAALSISGLSKIISPPSLLETHHNVFLRCMDEIKKSTDMTSPAYNIAVLCLDNIVLSAALQQHDFVMEVAAIIFPVLLLLPQTWRVNVKAVGLVKKLQWPFYSDIGTCDSDFDVRQLKSMDHGMMTSINIRTIQSLAKTFAENPIIYLEWLFKCSKLNKLAKCLFFFIILEALVSVKEDFAKILRLFEACFATIKSGWNEILSVDSDAIAKKFLMDEWCEVQSPDDVIINGELNLARFNKSYRRLANQLLHLDADTLSNKILICINWCILEVCSGVAKRNKLLEDQQLLLLDQLFLFFASSSSLNIFKKQLPLVIKNCCRTPFHFLSKYFVEEGFSTEVQAESLLSFAYICTMYASDENYTNENVVLSLSMFPSLLVPLASDAKEIRTAAICCIKGIYKLWECYGASRLKNGVHSSLQCISLPNFGDFLECIANQKRLISSDVNFLPSFLTSVLSSSSNNLSVQDNSHKRFEQSSKDAILLFILTSALKFPSYGKQKVLSLFKDMGNTLLQIDGCRELLLELLQKRKEFYAEFRKPCEVLLENEIETLCLLLEICARQLSSAADAVCVSCLMKALKVNGLLLDEPAVVKPCVTVLKNLTCTNYINLESNIQDEIFINLVFLSRCDNGDIRNAAREAVLTLNVNCTAIIRFLEFFCHGQQFGLPEREKRKKSITFESLISCKELCDGGEKIVFILGSLLDILLLKKNTVNRVSLVQPLFEVLGKLFSNDWLVGLLSSGNTDSGAASRFSESFSAAIYSAQHATLLILKDIIDSLVMEHHEKDDLNSNLNINLLVECARSATDATIRNQIFLLISSIAKISSEWLSEHIVVLFSIIGESAIKQSDHHSQQVLENLISVLAPCWLAKTNSVEKLFQIFIKGLPDIAENRRIAVIVYLVRTLGEKDSLGILYYHLFHLLTLRHDITSDSETIIRELMSPSSMILKEWEYTFALQLSNQYTSKIWLPALVKLLQEIEGNSKQKEYFLELFLALHLIHGKLRDTEFVFGLESGRDASHVQGALGTLMEQVVLHLQLLRVRCKQLGFFNSALKELRNCSSQILTTLTESMNSDTFFDCIAQLLGSDDWKVIKMTLGFLSEYIKDQVPGQNKDMKKAKRNKTATAFRMQNSAIVVPSFIELCSKISHLISKPSLHISVKLAAITSIETVAKYFPCNEAIVVAWLQCVVGEIDSSDLALSSACIRGTASLIGVLGSQSLKQLPCIMMHVFKKVHEVSKCPRMKSQQSADGIENYKVPLLLSTLSALEAVIANLGGFLNPYLDDILDVVILHSDFVSDVDDRIKPKDVAVRKLLTEKIPVRILLPPLLKVLETALRCGEFSISLVFEMLANMIGGMDRHSIGSYHMKIYEQCLFSLNIRHQALESVKNIDMVEQSVIHAMAALTMKLTETMFKPLFFHSLEWAESELEDNQTKSISIDRFLSFYSLVNKLIQQQRSLFVPYFKYLLGSSTRYLTEDLVVSNSTQKRKRAKIQDSQIVENANVVLSTKLWHLRALILKSLYYCFLYDTAETKFLNPSNFQVLLKPIISQLIVEPPATLNDYPDLPTVEDADEYLVLCLGQMAVTSRSDVLWKPLNHEVLMQTRNEKVRPKILGLRVIKYLVEHLREEYLVFLPETIPFLGELLEDVELPVKTMAQEILRAMELLSGESLKQYL